MVGYATNGTLALTTRVTHVLGDCAVNGTRYYYDSDPDVRIFIPDDPYFSLIKYYVLDGNELGLAMKKAGETFGFYDCKLEQLYPVAPYNAMAWAIRFFIYAAVNYQQGKAVSRPYGNGVWIHEEASKILQMYFAGRRFADDGTTIIEGRMLLAPGMMLPTLDEQTCITNQIRNSGKSIIEAFSLCGCPDILPANYIAEIENLIKTTTWHLFTIYVKAMTDAEQVKPTCPAYSYWDDVSQNCKDADGKIVDQICPEGKILDPATNSCKVVKGENGKKNYILYVALGIAAIFLMKGE